jgi:class 3 adenylate cyclase
VRAASALLGRLGQFNGKYNLLGGPIRVRQGVHTGHCLVDRRRRVAYSEVLDVAGHLQKHSEVNGLLISEATFEALPDGLPFEQVGTLERESIPIRRLSGDLD